ncbi:Chaperone DnaJ-domain superfamily protein isoform 1 [Hibiscus syriacus]|uniref:Chaperone DnaJ-domain superfamily protein isoform 1 n=1 Tax=Hibiscus syriacus TaxID=106335 RepID=A0A6A2XR17_HIBSY|nr:Chaperone DnaJ-domain superfamily protein isoform 1 [Hibiscus syriacus]
MSRRPVNPSRRYGDAGSGAALFSLSKSRSPPFIPIILTVLGVLLIVAYFHSGSGSGLKSLVSRVEGDFSCIFEVVRAIPTLKKAYGGGIQKVLHVGPDSCSWLQSLSSCNCFGCIRLLSPRYLNKTLPDFARVSTDGVVVFTGKRSFSFILIPELAGFPGQRKARAADVSNIEGQ